MQVPWDARPAVGNPLPIIDQYATVILASGIWNVRASIIMTTFTESYDFTGKTVYPVTTHAMSGLGITTRDYRQSCPAATIGEGLAVKGEEARRNRHPILGAPHRTPPCPISAECRPAGSATPP